MKYTVTPAEKSTVKLVMTFTPEEWEEAINQAYLENRKRYSVNGFRKGKVPKHVLELYYGKGIFYEDAFNVLYSKYYGETLEKEKDTFTAVGEPKLAVEDLSETQVVLAAEIPVKPDVQIQTYKGIKIAKYEYTVTDADVDREIQSVLERVAQKIEVTDRAAEIGDTVNIDFVGRIDGNEFEGGSAEKYDLTLGSHQFIPGFEEAVVGMKLGEVKDIDVVFPDDYQAEQYKGKKAVFTVTLHKITGKKLPELDTEFVKKFGCETVEDYRAKVRERLEQNAKNRSRNDTENAIVRAIAKGATAEIPDAMIDRQEEESMKRLEYELSYQGIAINDYLQYIGTTREEYKKNYEQEARSQVLNQLIVEKIVKLEKITASAEEIEAKIAEQAKSVGKEPEEYKKGMQPRQLSYIENDIIVTKLFDFLEANNEMVAPEELEKADGEIAATEEKKPAAKKTTTKSTTAKSTASKTTATKSTAAKSTTAKSTATKSTATKSTAAKTTTAKKKAAPKADGTDKE